MAGFVPIVVPAEGTIVELELQKKSLLKKYFTRTSSVSGTKRKESSTEDAELTAEDVDDLGDFAADIAEQEDIEAIEGEVSLIEIETEEIPQNFIVTQLRENSGQRNT
jgi:hypothetical protein